MAGRGRPKKVQEIVDETNQLIARREEENQKLAEIREQVQSDIRNSAPIEEKLPDVAFGITRDKKTQHLVVFTVTLDYNKKVLGTIVDNEKSPERVDVLHRFKVLSGNAFFEGN